MTMTKGYRDYKLESFGGGMNVLMDANDIDDNQFVHMSNFTVEGNKLITMKGNARIIDPLFETARVQGITSFGSTIFYIDGNAIKNFELNDDLIDKTKTSSQILPSGSNSTRYNITAFFLGDVYLVITDMDGVEDMVIKRFYYNGSIWTYATHTVLSPPVNLKFTCSAFYNAKLILGGNKLYPGNIAFSKTALTATAIATPDSWLDFGAYDAGTQIVDNQYPLVGFVTRQDVLYLFTTGNVWKVTDTSITGVSPTFTFQYVIKNETHTGAVSQYAICATEQDVTYFDGMSVRRLSFEANTLALKDASISEPVQAFIDAQHRDKTRAVVYFSYPLMYVAMRGVDSAFNSVAVVYNVINKCWSTANGVFATYATQYSDKKKRSCFGSAIASGVTIANETYTYDGQSAPIVAYAASKVYTTFDDVAFKRYVQIEFHGNISNGLTVEIDLLVNGKVRQTRTINGTNLYLASTGTVQSGNAQSGGNGDSVSPYVDFFERFEMFDSGRSFQFVIRQSGVGRFQLNFGNIKWKAEKGYPIHY